ncbi:MAG: hypothetical protein V1704_00755 [Candidatus Vogelbacteria bacterium]
MKKNIGFVLGFVAGSLLGILILAEPTFLTGRIWLVFIPGPLITGLATVMVKGLLYSSIYLYPISILLNGLIFALIGRLIQKYLSRRKGKLVV